MVDAYIGLGANLGQPAEQVRAAFAAIAQMPGVSSMTPSSLYRSAALGPSPQPDYCNAVCRVRTDQSPEILLDALLAIERRAGRIRDGIRWAPRLLDLDLLHVADCVRATATLTLPHPEIARRLFVVQPLFEIAPDLDIPGVGAIRELARTLGGEGLRRWRDEDHLL